LPPDFPRLGNTNHHAPPFVALLLVIPARFPAPLRSLTDRARLRYTTLVVGSRKILILKFIWLMRQEDREIGHAVMAFRPAADDVVAVAAVEVVVVFAAEDDIGSAVLIRIAGVAVDAAARAAIRASGFSNSVRAGKSPLPLA